MTLWKPYSIYLIACQRKQEAGDTTTSASYKSGVVPAPHKWYLAQKREWKVAYFNSLPYLCKWLMSFSSNHLNLFLKIILTKR